MVEVVSSVGLLLLASILLTAAATKMQSFSVLRQAVNLAALRQLVTVLQSPQLVVPQLRLSSVSDIDFAALRDRHGIRCVVFDKDNTLSLTYVDELHASAREAITQSRSVFGSHGLAILSNSVGSCDDVGYASALTTERSMGLPVIRHANKKPGCLPEVLQHFSGTGLLPDLQPHEICMVGDRVLTDVLFANLHGMLSILVRPISIVTDHPVAVLIRALETRLLLPFVRLLGCKPRPLRLKTT